jgi:hypothetical protein
MLHAVWGVGGAASGGAHLAARAGRSDAGWMFGAGGYGGVA